MEIRGFVTRICAWRRRTQAASRLDASGLAETPLRGWFDCVAAIIF
jgi:hypothetical protein